MGASAVVGEATDAALDEVLVHKAATEYVLLDYGGRARIWMTVGLA